ncbi:hypothetical protein WQ57_01695 [Mesobacillus campisalis]|uniref:DUF4386 domain-containing protein n=1 Tax=Mesobacillus campisalis TaxID=1408103 RepID=A0A0M2T424_9BACI|nr:hypothetical protein [Mesobacillus campisalis]KKK40007.1 hypothetical protein WQ57_01695 [Mesobacillus campisalis]
MNSNKNAPITSLRLIRWSGLAAMVAGFLFIAIQPIHPPENLSSVTSGEWALIHYLSLAMAILALVGITGIYAIQLNQAGWLGLVGFLMFSLFWIATIAFTFAEAFILPLLAADAPKFVEGYLGIFSGSSSGMDLRTLPTIVHLGGLLYILGGLLFGISTLRAGILPRWAAGVLAFGAVATLSSPLLPHPLDRILAVPMGIGLIWLGFSLFTRQADEKRK